MRKRYRIFFSKCFIYYTQQLIWNVCPEVRINTILGNDFINEYSEVRKLVTIFQLTLVNDRILSVWEAIKPVLLCRGYCPLRRVHCMSTNAEITNSQTLIS